MVQQIFIYGNSKKPSLVAVVVPDVAGFESIGNNKRKLMEEINAQAKSNDELKGFEMIRAVMIETELFTVSFFLNDTVFSVSIKTTTV